MMADKLDSLIGLIIGLGVLALGFDLIPFHRDPQVNEIYRNKMATICKWTGPLIAIGFGIRLLFF